jgi:hypothetical protein
MNRNKYLFGSARQRGIASGRCQRQCVAVRAAVHGNVLGSTCIWQCTGQCAALQQCGNVRQCAAVQQCVAVRTAVCGNARGRVRRCVAVRSAVRGNTHSLYIHTMTLTIYIYILVCPDRGNGDEPRIPGILILTDHQ